MDYQNVPVLNTTNFPEWRDKVKTGFKADDPEVWKLVCDGYCTDSPTVKEQQRNAKAKCVIYDNLHNKDLELIMDLTSAKEIWDRLHFIHGVDTKDCTDKKDKRIKKKKNSCQQENIQSNEVPASVNGDKNHEEIIAKEKSKLDTALTEIEKLKNENKDLKTVVQICDEREYEDKKEIVGLKTHLEEARKIEDTLLQQMRKKSQECERLEEEVMSLRKNLEKAQRELLMNTPLMKSSRQLDQIINAQRPPHIKAGIGYEGETSKSKIEDKRNVIFVKAVKEDEATQKIPTEEEASKNKICKETNITKQQHEKTKNEGMKQSATKGSYAPKDELNKFGRCQRRFLPPMKNRKCFSCHKPGHNVAYCKTKPIQSN